MLTGRLSLEEFLIEERKRHARASGDLNGLTFSIARACKLISHQLASGRLAGPAAPASDDENPARLQQLAQSIFVRLAQAGGRLAGIVSRSAGQPVSLDNEAERGKYLLIGVVPVINLEWIQKLSRDKASRGYSTEAVTDTILRRMPDYVNYICPQFSRTHVNFQRVPMVDTSNPFIARSIPTADESMLLIRFANPRGIDFPYLLSMIEGSHMSRANTIVCPGGKMALAMQLIFTPMIWRLVENAKKARSRG